MANVNKVILIGNVTRDPEVKFTPKGSAVTDIGLAVNRSFTLDNGEKREEVTFIDVTFWGRQAETIGEYVKKGRSIYVEGRLQLDSWDDKQSGQKRSKLRVIGENFQFLGARPGGASAPGEGEADGHYEPRQQQRPAARPAQRPSAPPAAESEERDDIPF